jgi:hypothetical protein
VKLVSHAGLSVTKTREARRFIDSSVIDTVGAGRFLELIEPEPVLYRLFRPKSDVAFVVHKPFSELPARREVKR